MESAAMKWSELSIHTTPEYVEPLSEFFRKYGARRCGGGGAGRLGPGR